MRSLLLALLLSLPAQAQFAHRSNPGEATGTVSGITTTEAACTGVGCVTLVTGGADTMFVSITGTWVATLRFQCSNNGWVTLKRVQAWVYDSTLGTLGAAATSTTVNGDFLISTAGFRECGVTGGISFSSGTANVRLNVDPIAKLQFMQGLPGGAPVAVTPPLTATVGTQIACNSGVSPCTVTSAALTILNANTSRKSCFLQAVDVVDLYCKRNTSASSAASATNFDFILNAGAATKKGGGTYSCDSSGSVWTGALNCIASAASAVVDLAVTETQ